MTLLSCFIRYTLSHRPTTLGDSLVQVLLLRLDLDRRSQGPPPVSLTSRTYTPPSIDSLLPCAPGSSSEFPSTCSTVPISYPRTSGSFLEPKISFTRPVGTSQHVSLHCPTLKTSNLERPTTHLFLTFPVPFPLCPLDNPPWTLTCPFLIVLNLTVSLYPFPT